jgi:DNA-binding beta-propeller fold protein YncE
MPVYKPEPQGLSPFAIAITNNAEFAYIGFDISDVVFKVRLSNLAIVAEADLSQYFPIESENIALDESEAKLFVYSPTWQKLIVLDTQTMSVTHTIENIGLVGMFRSKYGPTLITWNGGNSVKFVNTETYEVTEFVDPNEFFVKIQESNANQDQWYVVSGKGPGATEVNAGIYDHNTKIWSRKISLPPEARAGSVFDLEVLPNEQKAYVAIFGGWYPDNHAYGWLDSVDLVSGKSRLFP